MTLRVRVPENTTWWLVKTRVVLQPVQRISPITSHRDISRWTQSCNILSESHIIKLALMMPEGTTLMLVSASKEISKFHLGTRFGYVVNPVHLILLLNVNAKAPFGTVWPTLLTLVRISILLISLDNGKLGERELIRKTGATVITIILVWKMSHSKERISSASVNQNSRKLHPIALWMVKNASVMVLFTLWKPMRLMKRRH